MEQVLAPVPARTIKRLGGIELKPLMTQAFYMRDEIHNSKVAASSLLFLRLLPAALRTGVDGADLAAVAEFITGNDYFFLNLSVAACKAMLDAAAGVPHRGLVKV